MPDAGDRGEEDRVIDASVQQEMAQLIPHSRLKLYPGYGHGNSFANPCAGYVRRVTHDEIADAIG